MASDFPGLDGIYGPLEIGAAVCTLLYGIQTLQTFHYYRDFPKDNVLLKFMVAAIWFLELGQTICNLHANYLLTITFYGRPPDQMIARPPHSLVLGIFFTSSSRTLVELFFANRIRVLSGKWPILLLGVAMIISCLVGSLVLMAKLWTSPSALTSLKSGLQWGMIVFTSLGPLADILIASYMCFYLWKFRSREPQFRRTRRILDTLARWTVETTVLTSLMAVIQLVLFLARTDLLFLAFHFIQSKLYSNSMLAVLNGRKRLLCDDQVTGTGISEILAFDLPETKNEQSGDHVNSVAISNLNGDRGPNQVGEMAEVSPDYSIDRGVHN